MCVTSTGVATLAYGICGKEVDIGWPTPLSITGAALHGKDKLGLICYRRVARCAFGCMSARQFDSSPVRMTTSNSIRQCLPVEHSQTASRHASLSCLSCQPVAPTSCPDSSCYMLKREEHELAEQMRQLVWLQLFDQCVNEAQL
ncbi:unnamed protein product [Protopolystoma xenopodis]|uniref:Uncharacterized protein n=1 Tax=Protopolystoma xenopodis TaxID=117903 RepID=A0A448X7G4_9PLAT|nr:unnamed protein product [Protopolystoma xenopodis]